VGILLTRKERSFCKRVNKLCRSIGNKRFRLGQRTGKKNKRKKDSRCARNLGAKVYRKRVLNRSRRETTQSCLMIGENSRVMLGSEYNDKRGVEHLAIGGS